MKINLVIALIFCCAFVHAQTEHLIYHDIQRDASGKIISWYNKEPGKAYNFVINAVWNFWDTMRQDMNGLPYYMNHQVWNEYYNDGRGIGGDQLQMALSSWRLLYAYTGNEKVKQNMKFMADYYISHGFSSSQAEWADIPYPYNTLIYSGIYDGDMVIGKNFTQPDKAGSMAIELVRLYKMLNKERYPNVTDKLYLDAAIKIAATLAKHVKDGDENNSPLPFKVNALTGELGKLKDNAGSGEEAALSSYTTNWSGTMELFLELIAMNKGNVQLYQQAFDKILLWMKKYPLQSNKWGPFFEDVPGWSNTQINAVTFAQFIMNHREYFTNWKGDVRKILDWVYKELGNNTWNKYGVKVVNEQTAYRVPGNSHTSRQASAELQYSALSGDTALKENAILQLNWATYMVNDDGRNRYPEDENWLTDGYGDYVRHFLRAMAAAPELAPSNENHILSSSSIIQNAIYFKGNDEYKMPGIINDKTRKAIVYYRSYDTTGTELIHLTKKPGLIFLNNNLLTEVKNTGMQGFIWKPLGDGGILYIQRTSGSEVAILE